MKKSIDAIKTLIGEYSEAEQKALTLYLRSLHPHPLEKEWDIDAETIMSAIRRSSDLTKRGVRGIIAEAVFENAVMPNVEAAGWGQVKIAGNPSFDVHLQRGDIFARIQIKLQRLEKGVPKLYYPRHYSAESLYVVEVQKTRSGEKNTKPLLQGTNTTPSTSKSVKVPTRPYRFDDFDILAVNMHPSSGNWKDFRYTVASWLLQRAQDAALIEIFQPVASAPNSVWTDDPNVCLDWFVSGERRSVLTAVRHLPKSR